MNPVFRDYESQKMARIHAVDALMRIEPHIVAPATKKDLAEMFGMVLSLTRMGWQVVQLRLNDMANVMKSIGHRTLKSGSSVLQAEREIFVRESTPRTDECGLVLILRCNIDLIIS